MKSVELTVGKCGICHGPIDKEWTDHPGLGTVCRECTFSKKKVQLFGLENVEIQVEKKLRFDPLLGIYEYHFSWRGTKVMVNGKVGIVRDTYLGSCTVKFPDGPEYGSSLHTLDYWRLKDIYEKTGGEIEPPALNFEPHTPVKMKLLDEPILPVKVEMDRGNIRLIKVGHKSISGGLMGAPTELPNLPTLHAFANMYVRYKFGLSPNFCAEGGFLGRDFEVRNAGGFIGGVGLEVRMHPSVGEFLRVTTPNEFKQLCVRELLTSMAYDKEQARPEVLIKELDAFTILSTWVNVMETLLKYDWRMFTIETVEDVWAHYCCMQDVLLNIMPPEELSGALTYARNGKMRHCGSSY